MQLIYRLLQVSSRQSNDETIIQNVTQKSLIREIFHAHNTGTAYFLFYLITLKSHRHLYVIKTCFRIHGSVRF